MFGWLLTLILFVIGLVASITLLGTTIGSDSDPDSPAAMPTVEAIQMPPPGQCASSLPNARVRLTLTADDSSGDAPSSLAPETLVILNQRAALISPFCAVELLPDGDFLISFGDPVDIASASAALTTPGLLELIDPQGTFLAPGDQVTTTLGAPSASGSPNASPIPTPIYETIVTNDDLADAYVSRSELGQIVVGFELTPAGSEKLLRYTTDNLGLPISIVLDKRVVSSPRINGPISDRGIIEGMTVPEVQSLVIALKTSALPTPLTLTAAEETDEAIVATSTTSS